MAKQRAMMTCPAASSTGQQLRTRLPAREEGCTAGARLLKRAALYARAYDATPARAAPVASQVNRRYQTAAMRTGSVGRVWKEAQQSGKGKRRWHCGLVMAALLLTLQALPAYTQTLGMVADDVTTSVTVFNADTDTILGTVPLRAASMGDCSLTADQTRGFLTNFNFQVSVLDLTTSPPRLAGGPNPIAISNVGEDTAMSPDGKFLLVCDGHLEQPISVIEIATQTEIGTFALGGACTSIDICSNGSVLVTASSTETHIVRRLTLESTGTLTDTGETLVSGGEPNNVMCAPGGSSGIVITRETHQIQSFTLPGLDAVHTRTLSGGFGISGQISPRGDQVFIRSNGGAIDIFDYNFITGALGAAPRRSIPIEDTPTFFGMDQMVLHPNGTKLYVPQPEVLHVYNASTGAFLTSMTAPDLVEPTGVCFAQPVAETGVVNTLVTFAPIRSTFTFTPDPAGCPSGFVGTFRFEATLANMSVSSLSHLVVEVTALTGKNLLQNADGGSGGIGAHLTVPGQGGFTDGVLSPEESVDVAFVLCLTEKAPFSFFVDVFGRSAQ